MVDFGFHEHTAFFGGSFNPPHVGHVQAVKGLKEMPHVKRVMIIPALETSQKDVGTPFAQRLAMTKLAFEPLLDANNADRDSIEVSAVQQEHHIHYTWQLFEFFSRKIEKRAFVIGTDQFENLENWNRYPEIMGMSDWIVLIRKPTRLSDFKKTIQKYLLHGWLIPTPQENQFKILQSGQERKICFVETQAEEISSTEIRQKLLTGKNAEVNSALSPAVLDYIERNKLYGT